MGREKYENRQRHVYALTFQGRPHACYIGQSVAPHRRLAQHRLSGDWDGLGAISLTPLAVYSGTRETVEGWEMVWRVRAHQRGWRVYGGANDDGPYRVDPMKRAQREHLRAAKLCRWPLSDKRKRWHWPVIAVVLLTAAIFLSQHPLVQ